MVIYHLSVNWPILYIMWLLLTYWINHKYIHIYAQARRISLNISNKCTSVHSRSQRVFMLCIKYCTRITIKRSCTKPMSDSFPVTCNPLQKISRHLYPHPLEYNFNMISFHHTIYHSVTNLKPNNIKFLIYPI